MKLLLTIELKLNKKEQICEAIQFLMLQILKVEQEKQMKWVSKI